MLNTNDTAPTPKVLGASIPPWSARAGYDRQVHADDQGHWLIFDTAPLVKDPHASVDIEWLTTVDSAGHVISMLESFKISTGDESAFVPSSLLGHVIHVVCHAAVLAGVVIK